MRALRERGHIAYLAGGCVRDELLGLAPKDFDVATDARPEAIREMFRQTQEVGASFGVMLVKEGGAWTEVATFRSDGPYSDHRRPDHIEFSTPERDAARRDFTINALFLDPLADSPPVNGDAIHTGPDGAAPRRKRVTGGEVIDFVGGLDDLRAGIVRAVGDPDARLREDDLRALRAVRFASRLGFTIEEATADAIRAHAGALRGVSRERIGDEVRRMLRHPNRAVAAWTMQYLGLDSAALDEPGATPAPTRLGRLHDRAGYASCLAAWAVDRGVVREATQIAGVVSRWRRALNLSNDERDGLKAILEGLALIERGWDGLGIAQRKRAASSGWFDGALRVMAAGNPEAAAGVRIDVERLSETPSGLAPDPLITGDDLIAIGFRGGPLFKLVLDRVYDAQLEDRVSTQGEALELARELAAGGSV